MRRPSIFCATLFLFAMPGQTGAEPDRLVEQCLAQLEREGGTSDSCIGVSVRACSEMAMSTADQRACIAPETVFWSARLQTAYDQLLKRYVSEDAEYSSVRAVAPLLRATQEAWQSWRDAQCSFAYGEYRGGSMGVAASAYCKMQMTAERALQVETLLDDLVP